MSESSVVSNGVKVLSEAYLAPGGSLLLDGDLVGGGAHYLGGLVAKALLGPVGLVLVAANSYSKSTTGKHLGEALQQSEPVRKATK